jgi:hypothetical protein
MPQRLLGPGSLFLDALRASIAGGAIFVAGLVTTSIEQGVNSVPPTGSEQLFEVALRQGGLLLVLIVVLFFYRRDYVKLTDFWQKQSDQWQAQTKIIVELVQGTTKALTDDAAATREMSIVMHQAKNVMAAWGPSRRDDDLPPRRPS